VGTKVRDDWWGEVRAVLAKDLRSELRTKSAISTILMFSLTTIVLISFTVVTEGFGLTQVLVDDPKEMIRRGLPILEPSQTKERAALLSSLYWVILYFSAMTGLPRVFVKEEEMRTAAALRLTTRPSAVFTGKLCFNLALLEVVTLLLLPLFVLFFRPDVKSWLLLVAHLLAGAAAMAGAATLLGAMVSRAGNRGYLMVVLGFGPLLPILVLAINGTTAALHGSAGNNLVGLVSYLVMMLIVSGMLFEKVWGD
jgi:heme exporter protein B